ncbi:MAG: proton-conducting transporter membrane subunit, partial [Pseudomonadota bacterium]
MADAHGEATPGDRLATTLHVALALALFAWFCSFIAPVAGGEPQRLVWDWAPSQGIALSFMFDGLGLGFALLISGIGAMIQLYSGSYLAGHPQFQRFALYLTSFMLSMLGLVLADNLIGLFVFWELTTITSFLLIGFNHEETKSRRSAIQAMLVTGGGALALLAGILLLGNAAGTFEISEIVPQKEMLLAHPHYPAILTLVLLGAFTKSAQVPFHFWLPNAMAAPTPVSAFLHSATMVKGGVYLMARLHPALSGSDAWLWTLTIFGCVTAVFASFMALRQTDLKQALAYTTLMALGTLTAYLGQDAAYTLTAFITFLVVHSFYKACLFLVVGCVDHATGTREAGVLGGLGRVMPFTALAAALAAMSMAGLPPFLGFIAKELAYAGALETETSVPFVVGAGLIANALMIAVAGVVAYKPFWRPAGGPFPRTPHEAPWPMLVGPLVLATGGLVFGLAPHWLEYNIVRPTVAGFLGDPDKAKHLHLWAGINLPLIISPITFALGFFAYAIHRWLRDILEDIDAATPTWDPIWDRLLENARAYARWQTGMLQSGVLRSYLFIVFLTILIALGGTIIAKGIAPLALDVAAITGTDLAIFALMILGPAVAIVTSSRVTAIAGLGVGGIGVALTFIVYGAPDV